MDEQTSPIHAGATEPMLTLLCFMSGVESPCSLWSLSCAWPQAYGLKSVFQMTVALFFHLERAQFIIILDKPGVLVLSHKYISVRIILVYCLHTRLEYCCSWSRPCPALVQLQHKQVFVLVQKPSQHFHIVYPLMPRKKNIHMLQNTGISPYPGRPEGHSAEVVLDSILRDEVERLSSPALFVLAGCLLPPCWGFLWLLESAPESSEPGNCQNWWWIQGGECCCSARKMQARHGVKSTDISGTVACGMLSAVGTRCHSPKNAKQIICSHALPSSRASDTERVYQHCLTWDWKGEVEALSVSYLDLIRKRCSTEAPADQLWGGTVCAASKERRRSCTCMQRDAGWAGA